MSCPVCKREVRQNPRGGMPRRYCSDTCRWRASRVPAPGGPCFGCENRLPAGRRTWCSDECYQRVLRERRGSKVPEKGRGRLRCRTCNGKLADHRIAATGCYPRPHDGAYIVS